MGLVGTKLRRARGSGEHSDELRLMHWCPGCEEVHGYRVEGAAPGPKWTFNGNFNVPSFSPSMLITVIETEDDNEQPLPQPVRRTLCHYFIKTGAELTNRDPGRVFDPGKSYIDFCGDSPHALSGKVVELPDWPYAPGTYGGIE